MKAIAFCRVSSTQQDYTRQITDLKPLMYKDGYTDEDICIIKHKESAYKNDINNRKSISELKEVIENNPIEAVYCTEASRLARRGDVLYAVLALLEEHRISLVIQTPTLLRTYVDGKPNPIAHVVIAFMGQVAQQELELKKERQKSGYTQKVKDGKVCSSRMVFGYNRDKDGYAVIDEEKSKIVLDIFNMYLDGNSSYSIWDKYNHSGVFSKHSDKSGTRLIQLILNNPTYIGKNIHYHYPPIISEDLFNKVQEKLKSNILVKSKTKHIYYAQGLLRYNGYILTPNSACIAYTRKGICVNINVIDSLIWALSCVAKAQMNTTADKDKFETINEKLSLIESKLIGIKKDKDSIQKSLDRATKLYVMDNLSEKKFKALTEDLNGQMEHLLNEEDNLKTNQIELKAVIEKTDNSLKDIKDFNSIANITDDKTRQEIIRECIEYVDIVKYDKHTYNFYVHYKDKSLDDDTYYQYYQSGRKRKLYAIYGDFYEDWSDGIEERIKTKRPH